MSILCRLGGREKGACLLQGLVSPLVPGDESADEGALKGHAAYLNGEGANLGVRPGWRLGLVMLGCFILNGSIWASMSISIGNGTDTGIYRSRLSITTSGSVASKTISIRDTAAAADAVGVAFRLGLVVQNVSSKQPARVEIGVLDEIHHLVHKDIRSKGAGMAVQGHPRAVGLIFKEGR